ncbi:uncharacterized protein LOC106013799 [Aplysia californica]|uniref:Uncharacterized protein LOC106013799 n=1 Tax=Aplysia californica TaxID=6500 RepID=A0ABM1AE23_APLCA|nr:uncharacterized protein LOC106013799 [Aplysia californica]
MDNPLTSPDIGRAPLCSLIAKSVYTVAQVTDDQTHTHTGDHLHTHSQHITNDHPHTLTDDHIHTHSRHAHSIKRLENMEVPFRSQAAAALSPPPPPEEKNNNNNKKMSPEGKEFSSPSVSQTRVLEEKQDGDSPTTAAASHYVIPGFPQSHPHHHDNDNSEIPDRPSSRSENYSYSNHLYQRQTPLWGTPSVSDSAVQGRPDRPVSDRDGLDDVITTPLSSSSLSLSSFLLSSWEDRRQTIEASVRERQFANLVSAMEAADLETLIQELSPMSPPLARTLRDQSDNGLCHVAVRHALLPALRTLLLLQPGLQDLRNAQGHTPAALAITMGQSESLDLLLSHKPLPGVTSGDVTSLDDMAELARLAVQLGQESCLRSIAHHQGCDWLRDLEDQGGNSLLHLAALCGQPVSLTTLISLGCSTRKENHQGLLPIHFALTDKHSNSNNRDNSNSRDNSNNNNNNTDSVLETVHIIGNEDRRGEWMAYAVDRERFGRLIQQCGDVISPVLSQSHRAKMFERNKQLQKMMD